MSVTRRTAFLIVPVLGGLAASLLGPPSTAGAAPDQPAALAALPGPCPPVLKVADVRGGMRGRGLTVTRGRTPQQFAVEVRGVVRDGIAPGRDLILVEVSDLAGQNVIAQGGGIWAGMSGSPVYIGGKLLGAIAYGFTAAPSPIGGVTPAEDMVELLNYPNGATKTAVRTPMRVAIPPALRARLGAAAASGTSLERLRTPVGVSGLGAQRLSRFQSDADRAGLPLIMHVGGGASAPTSTTTMRRPTAGGNFVAALSYGDLTAAATGTTTAVCGNKALAFGHPFTFAGASDYGANDANALAIVKDNTFGSFKFATIGAPFGTVDQDRLVGVRARLGVVPTRTPITTSITNLDLGRNRKGRTAVTDQTFLPALTFFSLLGSYDTVFDEVGDGTAVNNWTITGTRAGGAPFMVRRSNRWASQFDISFEPAFDLAITVDSLLNNPYERVHIGRVAYASDIATTYRALNIADALLSVNGGPFRRPDTVRVHPGARLVVRAVLQAYRSATTHTVDLSLMVPPGTAGRFGFLELTGGAGFGGEQFDSSCLLASGGCTAGQAKPSLDRLLAQIRSRPRNDELSLTLQLDPSGPGGVPITRSTSQQQTKVVTGGRSFGVDVTP